MTEEGFLVAPASLTRVGVLDYMNHDGSLRRELRLPSEVFAQDSIESYQLKPVTVEHHGRLSSDNAARVTIGMMSGVKPSADRVHLDGVLAIYDKGAVASITAGKRQLSPGYDCVLEPVPGGIHVDAAGELGPAGQSYRADFYQREIRANHLAIVDTARAGATAQIRLDSAGNALAEEQETKTMKIKIGSTEHDVTDTVGAEIDRLRKDAADAEKLRAERDVLETQAKERQVRLDGFEKAEAEKAKAELVKAAHGVLGGKAEELSNLDGADIKKRVITKLSPALKLDGKGAVYVDAVYDALMATSGKREERADAADAAVKAALGAKGDPAKDREEREDGAQDFVAQARADYHASIQNAWKTSPTAKA